MAVGTGLAIGLGAQALGGLLGDLFASGDRKKARELYDQAIKELEAAGAPPDLSEELLLQELRRVGTFTPEMEQVIKAEPSAFEDIEEDQELIDIQRGALQDMLERAGAGFTPEEQAAFNQARREVAGDVESTLQQILQQQQMRGQASSGAALAAQLDAAQAGANRASAEGDRLSAMAARNAMDAIARSNQMAGNMRDADYRRSSDTARARDAIARFNAQNQTAIQSRNIAARNQAAQRDLDERQRISDTNTLQRNKEMERQLNAKRQFWADKLNQGQVMGRAKTDYADFLGGEADRTAKRWYDVGAGVGKALPDIIED